MTDVMEATVKLFMILAEHGVLIIIIDSNFLIQMKK